MSIPVGRALITVVAFTVIGYGVMAVTTPNEAQFYAALAPDLKKKVDDSRALQANARAKSDALAAMNASAESGSVVWAEEKPKK